MNKRRERLPLEQYLDCVCRRLWFLTAREHWETREELRQHLETLAAHASRSIEPADAMEEAMRKFGDPKQIGRELSQHYLRHRRWLLVLRKTTAGLAILLLMASFGYSAYWYFALSKPLEHEAALTPSVSAATTLAAIQAAQDGYVRQIQSVRFQSDQNVHAYYQGHLDRMVVHTFQVAAKGDRYYSRDRSDDRLGNTPNQWLHVDDVYVSDGKTMREDLTEWNGPSISRPAGVIHGGFAYLRDSKFKPHDPDAVLHYGYKVHGVWIADMLRRGRPSVVGTVTESRFGPLTVVDCRNKTPWGTEEAVRLWLAPRFGWLAVKTETQAPGARPPFALGMVYETQHLVKVGTLWVVSEGRLRYAALGLGRRQELGDQFQHFAGIAFNDVPDERFILHDPVGTRVLSADFQTTFVKQPSGQWKKEPVEDTPPASSEWWYLVVGLGAIGGAIGLLGMTRKRQKRRLA